MTDILGAGQVAASCGFTVSTVKQGGVGGYRGFFTTGSILADKVVPFGTAIINEKSAAGTTIVLSVDETETFQGSPSTKCVIAGVGTSTVMDVGVSSTAINLGEGAQDILNRHFLVAVKTDGVNEITNITLFLGDGSYSNYRTFSTGSYDTADGWRIFESTTLGPSFTDGTPIDLSLPQRAKARLTTAENVAAGAVWIAPLVAIPHPKPVVVFTCDDGYGEWEWLAGEAAARGIPISFGIASGLANTSGFLTSAQIQAIAAHPSGMFEITNHAKVNSSYATLGLSAYMADVEECNAFLVGLGLDSYAAKLHQYVQGSFDQTLIDALKANGYHSARQVGASSGNSSQNALIAMDVGSALHNINVACNLQDTQTLADVQANITEAVTGGSAFIMGHKFEPVAGTLTWVNGYDASHGVLNLLDWLADKRDNDGWQLMKWSDWTRRVASGSAVV